MALSLAVRGRLNSVRAWINGYTPVFHGPDLENAREALERLVQQIVRTPEVDAAVETVAKAIVAVAAATRQPPAQQTAAVAAAKKAAITSVDQLETLLTKEDGGCDRD